MINFLVARNSGDLLRLHDPGHVVADQHADRHDGKHLPSRQWDAGRVPQTGPSLVVHVLGFINLHRYLLAHQNSCVHVYVFCTLQLLVSYIWGILCQKRVYQAWISNCILQKTVGCNYLCLPEIPSSATKVLIYGMQILFRCTGVHLAPDNGALPSAPTVLTTKLDISSEALDNFV